MPIAIYICISTLMRQIIQTALILSVNGLKFIPKCDSILTEIAAICKQIQSPYRQNGDNYDKNRSGINIIPIHSSRGAYRGNPKCRLVRNRMGRRRSRSARRPVHRKKRKRKDACGRPYRSRIRLVLRHRKEPGKSFFRRALIGKGAWHKRYKSMAVYEYSQRYSLP